MPWPPRWLDLMIWDFFVSWFVKSQVYKGRVPTLDALKHRIMAAFALITAKMRAAAFREYVTTLGLCTWHLGCHVEALVPTESEP